MDLDFEHCFWLLLSPFQLRSGVKEKTASIVTAGFFLLFVHGTSLHLPLIKNLIKSIHLEVSFVENQLKSIFEEIILR